MAGAKSRSIAVLCFLLLIAMSQAAVEEEMTMKKKEPNLNIRALPLCEDNSCFLRCRLTPKACAFECRCRLRSFPPYELGRKVMMAEAMAAAEMEVEYNRAEAVLEEMMRGEVIRMNHKSTE